VQEGGHEHREALHVGFAWDIALLQQRLHGSSGIAPLALMLFDVPTAAVIRGVEEGVELLDEGWVDAVEAARVIVDGELLLARPPWTPLAEVPWPADPGG